MPPRRSHLLNTLAIPDETLLIDIDITEISSETLREQRGITLLEKFEKLVYLDCHIFETYIAEISDDAMKILTKMNGCCVTSLFPLNQFSVTDNRLFSTSHLKDVYRRCYIEVDTSFHSTQEIMNLLKNDIKLRYEIKCNKKIGVWMKRFHRYIADVKLSDVVLDKIKETKGIEIISPIDEVKDEETMDTLRKKNFQSISQCSGFELLTKALEISQASVLPISDSRLTSDINENNQS